MPSLLENAQQATGPDEQVRYAFTGQVGVKPSWRFLSFLLVLANRQRIVAVTPTRILVFGAGKSRLTNTTPKHLLYEAPRNTYLGPLRGSWSHIAPGSERIWVSRNTYPIIEKANAEAGLPGPASP